MSSGWFKVRWPNHWVMSSIALNEFVPIVTAAAIWGPHWQGCHVCFHSDNNAVVSVLVKRAAKDACMNHLLRTLFFYAAIYNFHFLAEHIPGTAADALSRNDITSFSSIFPQMVPVEVPAVVLDMVVEAHPDWSLLNWIELFRHSLFRASSPAQSVPTVQV